MSTIIRHSNRNATLRASVAALMRWYPTASVALIEEARRFAPDYPIIHGGSPRPLGRGAEAVEAPMVPA